ncbi:hypothetical protein BJF92_05130 [Rhizobium rhizosphaerae]|uniref:Uncharacterized protein n=1 Tax=Xaviernesmea rhizosphaerae TaxID=1672749 RepID=A0A1Q9AF11_9HYPH|nr:hypothetical protein [Xaviernesmea rhizosphaerae]OLP53549.1 hypothetical protein BJF92_05130 [Xaviernesmea rhizosphaerae]OQP86270.1 hypothetical protein BTR14_11280 [Xaviernesmea rhizosphaerae]
MTSLPQDLEEALGLFMAQQGLSRDEALSALLRAGLASHRQAEPVASPPPADDQADPSQPDPERVQYPGYFKGEGRL